MGAGSSVQNESDCNNRVQDLYDRISDRLSCGGHSIKLVSETAVPTEQMEGVKIINELYFKLGSLLEELAYQSADKAPTDRRYELALGEIGLMSEFVVQLAERNEDMNILPNVASEKIYAQRGDRARFWVGDFDYMGDRVDFTIMVRPKSHETPSDSKPGIYTESRQARLSIGLFSRKYNVAIRFDPEKSVCLDIVAPIINDLNFDNVNQSGSHHFYTGTRVSVNGFESALNTCIDIFSSMEKG